MKDKIKQALSFAIAGTIVVLAVPILMTLTLLERSKK